MTKQLTESTPESLSRRGDERFAKRFALMVGSFTGGFVACDQETNGTRKLDSQIRDLEDETQNYQLTIEALEADGAGDVAVGVIEQQIVANSTEIQAIEASKPNVDIEPIVAGGLLGAVGLFTVASVMARMTRK